MDLNNYNAMITKSKLFIALLEINILTKKIEDIKKCLDEGVNVNVQFKEFSNNTPLHIAVTISVIEIVELLLGYGAKMNLINDHGRTALDIAKELSTDKGRYIVDLLKTNYENPHEKVISVNNSIEMSNGKYQERNVQCKYSKRSGTSGISGHLYESKLLSLVLIRLLTNKQTRTFYLGNNIDGIGALDDLCIRYNENYENAAVFVQAKHKTDTKKGKISSIDLWREGSDFSLPKYFDSYLQIRRKFGKDNTDVMFSGLYEELKCIFILYTTVKDDLRDTKYIDNEKFTKTTSIRNLVNTDEECNIFQYKYEDVDIDLLTQTILEERLKLTGKKLLEFIHNNKYQMMINDYDIKSFHVVLAQKVIHVSEVNPEGYRCGYFREEFFNTNDKLLNALRDTLYSEAVRKTKLKSKEISELKRSILLSPCPEVISKLIGTAIKYDTKNNMLELVECKSKDDVAFAELLSRLTQSQIREAFEIAGKGKLKSLKFKLPTPFGNFDMTLNKSKADKRLTFLVGKIKNLIDISAGHDIITIDDSVVGPNKLLETGIIDVNGGIGGAMGNVLIQDEDGKSLKFNIDEENLSENAKSFLEKLHANIPNLDTYRFKINMVDFPRLSLDANEFERSFAKDFLNNLWFYTCQAKQNEIENIAKKEIEEYFNAYKESQSLFHIKADAIFAKFHHEVQKWWNLEGEVYYLTNNTQSLDSILNDFVKSPILNAINFFYINKAKALGIDFNEDTVESLFLDNIFGELTIIITNLNILSGVKLVQFFKESNTHIFIDLDYVLSLHEDNFNRMIDEISCKKVDAFIIMYENISKINNLPKVKDVIQATSKNRVILVTQKELATQIEKYLHEIVCVKVIDKMTSLPYLTAASQKNVLESEFVFQGEKLKFEAFMDEETKHLVNADILLRIINKETIVIGKPLATSEYDEISDNYVSRSLNKNYELPSGEDLSSDSFEVNTLEDLKGIIAVLAPPRTGKTIFMTNLSIQTKRNNPRIWIEKLDFDKNWHPLSLNAENEVDVNDIVTFMCKSALSKYTNVEQEKFLAMWKKQAAFLDSLYTKEEIKITDADFDVDITDGVMILKNHSNMSDLMLFELKLFIHSYNKGDVIFFVDNVDEIFLCFEDVVPHTLKFIASKAEQRIWITSSYNKYTTAVLHEVVCTSYKLEPVPKLKQYVYFKHHLEKNLNFEELDSEQFENLVSFIEYMRQYNDSMDPIKIMSGVVHRMYVAAVEFIQNLTKNNQAHTYYSKGDWNLDVDKLKSFDVFLYDEEFVSPQEMHLAADYFKRRIINNEFLPEEWNIDAMYIDYIIKMCDLKGTPYSLE